MTALDVTSSFIGQLSLKSEYTHLRKDFEVFTTHINFCRRDGNSPLLLASYVRDLLKFAKAIVKGVNSGYFRFACDNLSRKASCVYPRFLSGLTAKVFDENGHLRFLYDRKSLKLLLEILGLVRRVKDSSTVKQADKAGFEEFIGYQRQSRHFDESVISPMSALWGYLTRDIEKHAKIGFPGPGATLDEIHPYSPRFSFLRLDDLPEDLAKFYNSAFKNLTGQDLNTYCLPGFSVPWVTMSPHFCADNHLPVLYDFIHNPSLNTVVVPKNVVVSRAITIAPVGNTILGATLRNSIKDMWSKWGVSHLMNVDNQELSHRNLRKFFHELSLLDLEGGSSTLLLTLLMEILPPVLKSFFGCINESTFRTPYGEFPVKTLLMGDSIATGVLTTTMFLVDVLAYYNWKLSTQSSFRYNKLLGIIQDVKSDRHGFLLEAALRGKGLQAMCLEIIQTPSYDDFCTCIDEMRDLPFNNVGDDKLFLSKFEPFVRVILKKLGVTINEGKSSTADSKHKETCGCWLISNEEGIEEIYPFRCPEGDTKPLRLQASTMFLQRVKNSHTIHDLTVALAHTYGSELTASSHRYDDIGSPVGDLNPMRLVAKPFVLEAKVSDDLAYTFNLPTGDHFSGPSTDQKSGRSDDSFDGDDQFPHMLAYRISKRPPRTTIRYRRYRDSSKPRGLKVPRNYVPVFNSITPGDNCPSPSSVLEFEAFSSNFLEGFVLAFCETLLF